MLIFICDARNSVKMHHLSAISETKMLIFFDQLHFASLCFTLRFSKIPSLLNLHNRLID